LPLFYWCNMPRLSVPLTEEQHRAIKIKAAQVNLSQAEIARRLLFAWLTGNITLPQVETSNHPRKVWVLKCGSYVLYDLEELTE